MIYALQAMALHRTGQSKEAIEALQKSDAALDQAISEHIDSADARRPWIDLLEMVLLHREATLELTGSEAPLDDRIREAQRKYRDLQSF